MGYPDQRFDVNLSILFTELPLLERPAAASAAGFTAVELWWPWIETPTPEQAELDALKKALDDAKTQLVGLNFYAGQLPGPDRGALSVPGTESDRFRANIEVAADFAASTGCKALNALYGNRIDGVDPAAQDELALENLVLAAHAADRIGAILLIETLNAPESPRYPLVSAPAGIEVVDRINAATGLGNAKFLMDLYHLSMNGEDLSQVITAYSRQDRSRPDRRQPGARRARHRLTPPGAAPGRAGEGRLRRLGRPGVQARRPAECRVRRVAPGHRAGRPPIAADSPSYTRLSEGTLMSNNLPKVAWIGLGIMGSPMSENLIKAGYDVTGYTLEQDKIDRLAAVAAPAPPRSPRRSRTPT